MDIAVFVGVVLARFLVPPWMSLPLAVLLIGLLTLIVVLYDRYRTLRLDSASLVPVGVAV